MYICTRNKQTIKTMKAKLESFITKKIYTCKVVKRNETIAVERILLSYTKYSSFCVQNTGQEHLIEQLEIIGRLHNLDIENYDEFLFAVDQLKSSISWN